MARLATVAGLVLALVLLAAVPAQANLVFGRITQGDQPIADQDCRFVREGGGGETIVHTDAEGRYSVFLDPGVYKVLCGAAEGQARSHGQPLRQDINLK